jgi:hypothetical protein
VVVREWRLRWISSGLGGPVEERLNVRLMAGMVSVEEMSHNCFYIIDRRSLLRLLLRREMYVNASGRCGARWEVF